MAENSEENLEMEADLDNTVVDATTSQIAELQSQMQNLQQIIATLTKTNIISTSTILPPQQSSCLDSTQAASTHAASNYVTPSPTPLKQAFANIVPTSSAEVSSPHLATTSVPCTSSAAAVSPPYQAEIATNYSWNYNQGMYNNLFLSHNMPYQNTFAPPPPSATNLPPPSTQTIQFYQPPIRKLQDLPPFSGQPEEWPMFAVAYRETTAIHRYSDLENLSRLQKALRPGSLARQLVESLLIHPNSVNNIMSTLEFHYGRPEILIRSQLAKVRAFPNITEAKISEIVNFSTIVSNLTAFLTNAGASAHLCDPTLLHELLVKLPMNKREEWVRHKLTIRALHPSVSEFSIWLRQVATYVTLAMEIMPDRNVRTHSDSYFSSHDKRQKYTNALYTVAEDQQKKSINCIVCKANHHLYLCSKFKSLPISQRWDVVKTNRLCFTCLRFGHTVSKCSFHRECGISSCRKPHNRLLHGIDERKVENVVPLAHDPSHDSIVVTSTSELFTKAQSETVGAIICQPSSRKTLLKFLPVKLSGPKGTCEIIAFIDDGAKISLIEESVANLIGVKGVPESLSLRWIGDKTTNELSQRVDLEICGLHANAVEYQMRNVRTVKQLLLPAQSLDLSEMKKRYSHLQEVPIDDYYNAVPRILIGVPHTNLVRPTEVINIDTGFSAHYTKLGWTLFGSNEENVSDALVSFVGHDEENILKDLQLQVAEYFAIENIPPKSFQPITSEVDKRAEKILRETTRKINGQYETGLLWKNDEVEFIDNYDMALQRLKTVEKRLERDNDFTDWYKNKIKEYVSKNYARKLSAVEINTKEKRIWYLPHFGICNINKGNKLRLVFDAAASVNGISLNSMLLKGPDRYQPKSILSILQRFRERRIGVCADIKEMFHRINIRKEDQNCQRFLWRDGNSSRPPDIYIMTAMIFGSASSPCSAQYVKNLNAREYEHTHPRAFEAIVERHYVDDYVDSFDNVSEAINVVKAVKDIHSVAGFELRSFVSNSPELLDALNESSKLSSDLKNICHSDSNTEKILGMFWDSKTDNFRFVLNFRKVPTAILDGRIKPTKSQVLSLTMSIFDPFGFLANVVIKSKLLLQDLWRVNTDWTEQIPEDVYQRWFEWYRQLDLLKEFKIPRCYHPHLTDPCAQVELHIFVDASEVAFSAVGYWRNSYKNDVDIVFVMGKTRCSPIKALSIPRLELQAAVLGVRLKEIILKSHEIKPINVTLWSDSKTVIHWIRSDSSHYKQFVGHRIAEILNGSEVKNWRWVPGSLNPADDATRPKIISKTPINSPWITGPSFLKLPMSDWPQEPKDISANEHNDEKRSKFIFFVNDSTFIALEKFSNYHGLLKTVCWVLRAVKKFMKTIQYSNEKYEALSSRAWLTVKEMTTAEITVCRIVQNIVFSNEMRLLSSTNKVPKSSSIFKLTPKMDEDGIIRLGGRIDNANCVPLNTKRPIILPKDHALTRLIVQDYHEKFHHQNQEAIVCAIRTKFWIPSVRRLVRSMKSRCQFCKNLYAVPEPPLMGQLPIDRLTPYVRPFSYTGVDYFGPIQVAVGRRSEKRWVALFTCLSTRAIHLELAKDLSTEATILCLRNFINRRGTPVRIRSDRGTNFVGASKEDWIVTTKSIQNECIHRGVEWLFNTPGDPSAGGVWERMVRCVKNVLSLTLKEKTPQVDTLQSLLIEAENLVNSRPLTHLPIETEEAEPLTPNHFLLGCPNYVQTPEVKEGPHLRKQWHILQQLKQMFWKRWVSEYLPIITRRTKWHTQTRRVEVGDIVVICDGKEGRGEWKRGRIVRIFPAPDGQVRSAAVKTSNGILRRPVSKLAKLDVMGESRTSIHGEQDVAA